MEKLNRMGNDLKKEHSWDEPCDIYSFKELIERCPEYDEPFDYEIFCDRLDYLSGKFYVWNTNYEILPTQEEENELCDYIENNPDDTIELIQLVDVFTMQEIIQSQKAKNTNPALQDYWHALQTVLKERTFNTPITDSRTD